MSIDEIAEIHERLGEMSDALLAGGTREGTIFAHTGIWMFLIGIPALMGLLLLIRLLHDYFSDTPGVTTKFIIGSVVLVGGAAGIEIISNFVRWASYAYSFQSLAEEFFEMLGVTIMLWAAVDLLQAHGFEVKLQPTRIRSKRTEITPDES